ncbi:hypothetical protein BGZ54_006877 [Gamsiella multidivaricata]|nr:hypothetical protein BGZ54_006877 [Gamsiella multidivaricata]
MDDRDTIYKKTRITNQQGRIAIKGIRADRVDVYSVLSGMEAREVRSGRGKTLDVSAVSPVGAVVVSVAKVPRTRLDVKAISGRLGVDVALPRAYTDQVALKTSFKNASMTVEEDKGMENVKERGDGQRQRLRNRVRLESRGQGTHVRLSYH